MSKKKILCIPTHDHLEYVFSKPTFNLLKHNFDVEFNVLSRDYTSDEVATRIKGFDALITGWGSPVLTANVFDNADNLRIIVHSAGSVKYLLTNDVVQRFIVPKKICVCNAPGAIAYNVAETTLGLLIMMSHRLFDYAVNVKEKALWRDPSISREVLTVNGSTIGIVGASTVGREVIRLLQPFDAKILVYDPYLSDLDAEKLCIKKTSLEDLFSRSDFVSIHAPLTDETYHLINERHLKLLRDGAVLVNTSRGKVIDQEALLKEVETGRIFVALDVTDPEPLPAESPLRGLRNVIVTPHVAGMGVYGMKKIGEEALQALVDFFAGRKVKNKVNLEKYDILG
jgi:phosphoglycerate dehydrogenase-like enzyme